jgi:hypothetical protein
MLARNVFYATFTFRSAEKKRETGLLPGRLFTVNFLTRRESGLARDSLKRNDGSGGLNAAGAATRF